MGRVSEASHVSNAASAGSILLAKKIWTGRRHAIIFNHMVKYNPTASVIGSQKNLDMTFRALSDRTRRAIIERLTHGDALVTELARPFDISLPAVSKHLGILEDAGLISREKDGRVRRCHLDAAPLKDAADWIAFYKRFWEGNLDALEDYLQQQKPND